jgi:hypothetical protein
MLTRAIRDNAILVNGYASAQPFFATNQGDESYEGTLEAGVVEAASLSQVGPVHGCVGEVEDGTHALLGLRLLYQPTREEHWLRRRADQLLFPPRDFKRD